MNGPELHPKTVERLMCESTASVAVYDNRGVPLDMGRTSRRPNSRLRRALALRDRMICQAPGCHRTGWLHAHHVDYWSLGGRTDIDNLILLCEKHHLYVHEGGYTIRSTAPNEFQFVDPSGDVVPTGVPLPAALPYWKPGVGADDLRAQDGQRMDLDTVLFCLMTNRERRRAAAAAAALAA